jgi:hypothetical protein
MSELITTKKQLANFLNRSRDYARDCERGGLRLPCREETVLNFLRENPRPTRFRRAARRHR